VLAHRLRIVPAPLQPWRDGVDAGVSWPLPYAEERQWPGFAFYGGYTEFLPVPYEYLIRIDHKYNLKPEELAPLTDAGLTPYRGIKKLRNAGALGPDRVVAVIGIGGLGAYAIQYARLLSSGATVVGFGRSDEKLAVAKEYGADDVINTRKKSLNEIRHELYKATGHNEDASGTTRDDKPYRNTYAWFLDMRDSKVVKAFAFFDSVVFNEFWQRVKP
jgi:threonine dehydrogenase-like Zn-dependent dehydrogenase